MVPSSSAKATPALAPSAAGGDDDGDDGEGAEGEHVVDDSKLKLPDVKLDFVKVSTMEEDEEPVYKQYVLAHCAV